MSQTIDGDGVTDEQQDTPEATEEGGDSPVSSDEDANRGEASSDQAGDEGPGLVEIVEDSEVLALRDEVAGLQARLRAVSNAYRELQEEITATRDRLARQATAREERRRGEVVQGLFDPLQNLRRSIDATRKGASQEDTIAGLEIVVTQFMDSFKGLGLEEVPGKGTPFNPNLHEALTTMPVADPALDDVVIDVFDVGYRIGGTLIQPARVIVGRYTAPEDAEA